MRSDVRDFHLEMATSLAGALATLAKEPDGWSLLAGGTDVMVLLEAGLLKPRRWLGINRLRELKGIHVTQDAVEIGALTTYTDVREHPVLRQELPSLVAAAADTGGLAIQNRGTIGGNIANASPAADTPPALLSHDAEIELQSSAGARWLRYDEFHLGYKRTALKPGELITRVRLARPSAGLKSFYRKVGTRKAQAISKVVLAGSGRLDGGRLRDVRLALGSVAATTVRCRRTEATLEGQTPTAALFDAAVAMLANEIAPIDDIRSTKTYRLEVAGNVLKGCLQTLARG